MRQEERIAARDRKKKERLLVAQGELDNATEIFLTPKGLRLGSRRSPIVERFEGTIHPKKSIGVFRRKAVEVGTSRLFTSLDGVNCDQGGPWSDALLRASLVGKVRPFSILQIVLHNTTQISSGRKTWPAGMPFVVSLRGTEQTRWGEFLKHARNQIESRGPFELVLTVDRASKKPKVEFSLGGQSQHPVDRN